MINNKGFTLSEVLIASSILFIIIVTIIPINSLISSERHLLKERYENTSLLYEELQTYVQGHNKEKQLPHVYKRTINKKIIEFKFEEQSNKIIKGCVEWINVRETLEKTCLYGYR